MRELFHAIIFSCSRFFSDCSRLALISSHKAFTDMHVLPSPATFCKSGRANFEPSPDRKWRRRFPVFFLWDRCAPRYGQSNVTKAAVLVAGRAEIQNSAGREEERDAKKKNNFSIFLQVRKVGKTSPLKGGFLYLDLEYFWRIFRNFSQGFGIKRSNCYFWHTIFFACRHRLLMRLSLQIKTVEYM